MSRWTFISGVIRVGTPARSTEQAEYIVKTVLNHLPQVTGSERNMCVTITPSAFYSASHDTDEFDEKTDNLKDGDFCIYTDYLLTVEGNLRDRLIQETHREFVRWLCRLSKRLGVDDICVKITDHRGREMLITDSRGFEVLYEIPPLWVEQIAGHRWWDKIRLDKTYPEGSGEV